MVYSETFLQEAGYNPVKARAYFWTVAMKAKHRALVAKREIIERGQTSAVPLFEEVFAKDCEKRRWVSIDEHLSEVILENIDALVRSGIKRPPVCEKCKYGQT